MQLPASGSEQRRWRSGLKRKSTAACSLLGGCRRRTPSSVCCDLKGSASEMNDKKLPGTTHVQSLKLYASRSQEMSFRHIHA